MDRVVPYGNRPFPECRGCLEPECPHPSTRMSCGTGLSLTWAPGCPPQAQGCHTLSHANSLAPWETLAPWHSHLLGMALAQPQSGTTWPWCYSGMQITGHKEPRKPRTPDKGGDSLRTQGHGGCEDSDSWCFCLKQECSPFELFFGSCGPESWGSKMTFVHGS